MVLDILGDTMLLIPSFPTQVDNIRIAFNAQIFAELGFTDTSSALPKPVDGSFVGLTINDVDDIRLPLLQIGIIHHNHFLRDFESLYFCRADSSLDLRTIVDALLERTSHLPMHLGTLVLERAKGTSVREAQNTLNMGGS